MPSSLKRSKHKPFSFLSSQYLFFICKIICQIVKLTAQVTLLSWLGARLVNESLQNLGLIS